MNREIKFRIWADNKFYNKCLVGNTNNTNDEKWTCPMVWLEKQKEWVHCDNGIICQYTGLHDKDGQEIYEGDIVKVHFKKGCWKYNNKNYSGYKNGNIEFCVDCFIVYIKNYKEKIYPLSSFGKGQLKDIEKIGNIYDNQELLGGK